MATVSAGVFFAVFGTTIWAVVVVNDLWGWSLAISASLRIFIHFFLLFCSSVLMRIGGNIILLVLV